MGIKSEDIYVCVYIYSILMSSREHPSQKRHETMREIKCLS